MDEGAWGLRPVPVDRWCPLCEEVFTPGGQAGRSGCSGRHAAWRWQRLDSISPSRRQAYELQCRIIAARQRLAWCSTLVGVADQQQLAGGSGGSGGSSRALASAADAPAEEGVPPPTAIRVPLEAVQGASSEDPWASALNELAADVLLGVAQLVPSQVSWVVRRRVLLERLRLHPAAIGSVIALCCSKTRHGMVSMRLESALRRLAFAKVMHETLSASMDVALITEMSTRVCMTALHGEAEPGSVNAWRDPAEFTHGHCR
jgi:hypothetical protein